MCCRMLQGNNASAYAVQETSYVCKVSKDVQGKVETK